MSKSRTIPSSTTASITGSGLKVERRFTRPGVHPFDEVQWELRTASITNEKGEVVFEQKDVEIPASWSQMATNVVVSKYFRGQLGTARRETSVKQLIGRVVDTISDWGVAQGYFASDEDAQAFRAELAFLCVTQRMAFNSPVWFNVGVEEKPQGSACQPHRALISTPDGLIPIGELVEKVAIGQPVYDSTGITAVVGVKANGLKEVFRVGLRNGAFIEATADHLVRAAGERRQSAAWLRVDQLKLGMRLHLFPHRVRQPMAQLVPAGMASDSAVYERFMSETTDVEVSEAALAGWLQADGFVGQYEHGTNRSLTVEFETVNEDEYRWVIGHLEVALPGIHHKVRTHVLQNGGDYRRVRIYGEKIREFVERWEILGRRHEIRVPSRLWTAPQECVVAYLRSVFQSDGYVSLNTGDALGNQQGKVGFAVISEKWTEDIQLLLNNVGIYSRRIRKTEKRTGRSDLHEVAIGIGSEKARFAELIGFVGRDKQAKLSAALNLRGLKVCGPLREESIVSIVSLGVEEVYDIQTTSGEYLTNHVSVHNCFINSIEDTMESILGLAKTEGMLFKYGSGAGVNLSALRGSMEKLKHGGTASGPVSFMKGFDAFAGAIKSGGATRRAAKMVILNVDHPDIEEFINCKVREEKKAWALIDAGYDGSYTGEAYGSVFFQNSNNSIRVPDEFMKAVENDSDWHTLTVTDRKPLKAFKARELMRQISDAAWVCGDPGMQYDTIIQDWNCVANTARINATNPCFTGDTEVHTTKGLIRFTELLARVNKGETFRVYTHDATSPDAPADTLDVTSPSAFMITGYKEVFRLRFANGMEVRCTPNHRFWTTNRGYVRAEDLTKVDSVLTLAHKAVAVDASYDIPVSASSADYRAKDDHLSKPVEFPTRWNADFAHYLGWMVGDGFVSEKLEVVGTVYGTEEEQGAVMPQHHELVTSMSAGFQSRISHQGNGTAQVRTGRKVFARFFKALGMADSGSANKVVPWAIKQAPPDIAAAFLRGLFDADGCVHVGAETRYVGLGSRSEKLVRDVQKLLTTYGISSRIYSQPVTPGQNSFHYTRKDGEEVTYEGKGVAHDLRISGTHVKRFYEEIGFSLDSKMRRLEDLLHFSQYKTKVATHLRDRQTDGTELTYNLTEPKNHSYVVSGLVVANCSEFVFIDDTACNLASLNLMKFIDDQGTFLTEDFKHATRITITAQEMIVPNASYPTPKIGENSLKLRPLGLGFANLGALLMSQGLPYDSDEGRAYGAAVTSLMTAEAYAQSSRIAAACGGPFELFAENREPMLRVMNKHMAASYNIDRKVSKDAPVEAACQAWEEAVALGVKHGYRNAQATVLAPTGCLTGNSLVMTDRGLVRLRSLGDPNGQKWQDLDAMVATDDGPRKATRFYVNGVEPVVTIQTKRGYRIQGTPLHRIRVVDANGDWQWRRLADVRKDDSVPMMLGGMLGNSVEVALPPLAEAHWNSDPLSSVPRQMTPDLAELVGYFMGDGSLHSKGLRFCVANTDLDVVDRLVTLGSSLFGLSAAVSPRPGYTEVAFHSVRLTLWWEACGFAKTAPSEGHRGKGYGAHIPDAVLHANAATIYGAFLRGLFESDGTVSSGYASVTTVSEDFALDLQSMLLALGLVSTRRTIDPGNSWGSHLKHQVRLLNVSSGQKFADRVGFISARKSVLAVAGDHPQAARYDQVPVSRGMIDMLLPENDNLRKTMLVSKSRTGMVSRRSAVALMERMGNNDLGEMLGFYYDRVESAELGEEQMTYDLSVPENVTYVANGFVSHNTIAFMMDCDTTGVEPDIALVKYKKLVGGGLLKIVNGTVPRALNKIGYDAKQVDKIIGFIADNDTIEGAPALKSEHLPVFDCAFKPAKGERSIHYMGHLKMVAAAQPFISGSISKTINLPELATVEDIEQAYVDGWKMGLKCISVYRDNCKRSQPLNTKLDDKKAEPVAVATRVPVRSKLPDERQSITHKFDIQGHEGYITVSMFDDRKPGEIFVKMAKEGSTLSGMMDSFAIMVSLSLQYGVPLEALVSKFSHVRFEPSGYTSNPEIPIAKSIVDYIFRWLASKFYDEEGKEAIGIIKRAPKPESKAVEAPKPVKAPVAKPDMASGSDSGDELRVLAAGVGGTQAKVTVSLTDSMTCSDCGAIMVRAGACYKCLNCGSTSGCG
ncbi:MAG: LAGLIDADG family homing endonuclease [Candidatus Dormibacteria bacterium]